MPCAPAPMPEVVAERPVVEIVPAARARDANRPRLRTARTRPRNNRSRHCAAFGGRVIGRQGGGGREQGARLERELVVRQVRRLQARARAPRRSPRPRLSAGQRVHQIEIEIAGPRRAVLRPRARLVRASGCGPAPAERAHRSSARPSDTRLMPAADIPRSGRARWCRVGLHRDFDACRRQRNACARPSSTRAIASGRTGSACRRPGRC